MKSSVARKIYDLIWWVVVALLLYLNRKQLVAYGQVLDSIFAAYSTVVLILICIVSFLVINYLREALAATVIAFIIKLSGGGPLNYEKGDMQKNLAKTARRLERKGEHVAAGETYENSEDWTNAARAYEAGNSFGRAAAMSQKAGNTAKALELYERDKDYEAAANLARTHGMQERANKDYRLAAEQSLEQNLILPAARLFELAHDFNRAGTTFESGHRPDEALRCYEKSRNAQKVLEITQNITPADLARKGNNFVQTIVRCAELIASSGNRKDAAHLLENAGELGRAAEMHESAGDYASAGELYLKGNQLEAATKAYSKVDDPIKVADFSARAAHQKGDWKSAAEFYEKAGKLNQAIDAYKRVRLFNEAGRLYEQLGRYIMAGEMYSSAKNIKAAAEAYARAYDWRNAAECYESIKDFGQACEAYTNAGNYLKAGILAMETGENMKAVELLQRVAPASSDYKVATGFLATAFHRQGRDDMAGELYGKVMGDLSADTENLPIHLGYAQHLEKVNPVAAIPVYRQIVGVNTTYYDADQRLKELEAKVANGTLVLPSAQRRPAAAPSPSSGASWSHASSLNGGFHQQATVNATSDTYSSKIQAGNSPKVMTLENETTFGEEGRYRIIEQMFSDGNSIFYRASDIQLERPVILRTSPLPHNPDEAAAFLRLVRAIGRLSHPNIATIYDTGAANDLAFIASEIPEGQSSFQQIRTRGPLNVSELKSTMRKVLTGLDYAHSQEIIHGNLKPANINVNSALNAKLTNFSFPTMARPGQEAWSTNSTISAMDPQFLAPEQIMGNPSDARADIYAVGLLIFYFLTGRTPFEVRRVSDVQEIARIQIQSALPRPSTVRATVPNRIDEIFMKCTHKSPAARFQSVNEVLDQLEGSESNFTG